MKICAYAECGQAFEPATHNQRYHTAECCRRATNARIMEDYYAKKARRSGRIRRCSNRECSTVLSRYNDQTTCGKCSAEKEKSVRSDLLRMLSVTG